MRNRTNRNYTKPATLFQYRLTNKQQVYTNYLIPALFTSFVYIFHFAGDLCLTIQHYRDENYRFASVTFLWMFVPVYGSLFFILSDTRLWPQEIGFGWANIKWMLIKFLQHSFFPVWAMYRFAEQIFWSLEAVRFTADNEFDGLLKKANRNSVFELYHFLQAYLQAAPQILFQLHVILQQRSNFVKTTVDMQVFSIILSLIKMALTTMSYQRFKSQKVSGKQYPWIKPSQIKNDDYQNYINQTIESSQEQQQQTLHEERKLNTDEEYETENSEPEADRIRPAPSSRRNSGLSVSSSQFDENELRKKETTGRDQSDFVLPFKIITYRALPEDDAAGKLISFFWWFCFILPRMLALSVFAYFFAKEIWWITSGHFVIVLGFLLYDAFTTDIPYYRAPFLLFTAYVYIFCLIEFKIRFKKVKFIYYGYFIIVYMENCIMTSMWYYNIEFDNDWWYKYIFYLIVGSSILSSISMLFYIFILKPAKVTINKEMRVSKVL